MAAKSSVCSIASRTRLVAQAGPGTFQDRFRDFVPGHGVVLLRINEN
jgi:hypothetical protein